jgi:glutamyl-tRNA reductase
LFISDLNNILEGLKYNPDVLIFHKCIHFGLHTEIPPKIFRKKTEVVSSFVPDFNNGRKIMIELLGLNHKSAPIEVREKFVFCEEDIKRFVPMLQEKGINGAVIISTCNRTEIYVDYDTENGFQGFEVFEETLFEYRKADRSLSTHFYRKSENNAARHLFHVVSGLDSMALGEYQIVGQVKEAFTISESNGLISPVLIRLFNKAFEAGKRVRSETSICKGAVSVSYAAVDLASKQLHKLQEQAVLLIGAGQTSELTLQNLIKKGCNNFTIINRTDQKAVEMADKYKARSEEYAKMEELLLENNIVISSTASKKPLITKAMVEYAMMLRNNKPLFFIDLSVPRNIAHEVAEVENVFVYDVDALNNIVEDNFGKRRGEICAAEQIIEEVVSDFVKWMNSRNLIPTFQSISNCFQSIHRNELEGFKKNTKEIDYQKATEYGEHITNKLIRTMISNVRSITDNGKRQEYISLVNQLFTPS